MKQTLIALGVAAGLAGIAQAAENTTTLYGSLGYETQIQKNIVDTTVKVEEYVVDLGEDATLRGTLWDLNTATAKLGVKGSEMLNNGIEAFYKFEYGFDTSGDGLNETR